ncbi:MAG TPA: DUF1570 domain-containing protein [Phycisphaerae bacterium]|nr:DUF1570 domain-containing protein [Phycisphaerae bacterium]
MIFTAAVVVGGAMVWGQVPADVDGRLRTFSTPHYMMHTDLPEADAREADLRMTRMFEEYQRRTAGFSGQVTGKFPFYLFTKPADYYASGAIPDSDGVFIIDHFGSRLMAIAGEHTTPETWHVVQHEGFHQFAANVIKGELPIWVNEGIAEYFGEAIWTGDSFVSGVIPPQRLKEVNVAILRKTFKPFDRMMTMTHEEWGSHLDYANYTQAWAMVQFLAQGENGKYQGAFVRFMQNLNRGMAANDAWNSVFGNNNAAFQSRFEKWWLGLPKNPTRDLYMRALVQTLTSFLARATMQKQTFTDVDDFVEHVKLPDLQANRDMWLPGSLFEEVSPLVKKVGTWSLGTGPGKLPELVLVDEDGSKYVGTFTVSNNRISVNVAERPGTTVQKK